MEAYIPPPELEQSGLEISVDLLGKKAARRVMGNQEKLIRIGYKRISNGIILGRLWHRIKLLLWILKGRKLNW